MPKQASLGGSIVSKGRARPADASGTAPAKSKTKKENTPSPEEKTRALTLKVPEALYKSLRMHSVNTDQTHQEILSEALVEYLSTHANA